MIQHYVLYRSSRRQGYEGIPETEPTVQASGTTVIPDHTVQQLQSNMQQGPPPPYNPDHSDRHQAFIT